MTEQERRRDEERYRTMDVCRRGILDSVDEAIAAEAAEGLELPHVVYVFDHLLGIASAIGPFPNPIAASEFAEQYLDDVAAGGNDRGILRVEVIPLEGISDR